MKPSELKFYIQGVYKRGEDVSMLNQSHSSSKTMSRINK